MSTLLEKEKILLERITKAKQSLIRLRERRKQEMGKMALEAGLDGMDDQTLKTAFERLAKELQSVNTE